jgi:hypothetical protein
LLKNVEWCYLTSKRCGVKGFVQDKAESGLMRLRDKERG